MTWTIINISPDFAHRMQAKGAPKTTEEADAREETEVDSETKPPAADA